MKTVVVIGCGKSKLARPAAARDLYTGSLFRACRAYAERSGHPWVILSAEHFVLPPEVRVAPYENRITRKADGSRWARVAVEHFAQWLGGLRMGRSVRVVCLAGASYADPFCAELYAQFGISCEQPLRGLGLGQRLRWLAQSRRGER